ncbi:hypothetical protein [Mucilaginibacter defluvii]|uniref:Fimbrillin-A associated anchor protein Mfa1/Mfa2 n=1 Tax=Mucilaginibacter defluvii TaxID=1196019 RepID=A0ABP9FSZ1_9SPHI
MKKTFYLFALIGLAVLSCKKDGKSPSKPVPEPDNKEYTVNFNVGIDADSQKVAGVAGKNGLTTNALVDIKSIATYLQYRVYDASGKILGSLIQLSNQPNFGKLADSFKTGEYTVVVWAASAEPDIKDDKIMGGGRDVFYKRFTLKVDATTAVNQEVNLQRIVGQLQVKILDTIPNKVSHITLNITNDYGFDIPTGVLSNTPSSFTQSYSATDYKGKPDFVATTYVLNTVSRVNVKITSYRGNDVFTNTTVNGVKCLPNKRTILSGKIFSNPSGVFNFTFNDWEPVADTVGF